MKKFIRFFKRESLPKKGEKRFDVMNHKGEYLGVIEFYKKWKKNKQWVFYPDNGTFYTDGCLEDISKKLKELNE